MDEVPILTVQGDKVATRVTKISEKLCSDAHIDSIDEKASSLTLYFSIESSRHYESVLHNLCCLGSVILTFLR